MIKTVVIQIGNSDDKLIQSRWSCFVEDVNMAVHSIAYDIHFSGGSLSCAPWQNYCWVIIIEENNLDDLFNILSEIKEDFNQDAIAVTVGDTKFI